MDRESADILMKQQIKNKNLRKHMYATEAVLRDLASELGEDQEIWGLAGLLHDLDYEKTLNNFARHGYVTVELLEAYNLPQELTQAIIAHPGHVERSSSLDHALYAADPLTGLIVASALIHPDKKLASLDSDFVLKRFQEKRFAAGANREQISSCSALNMSLEKFTDAGLKAMTDIASTLGL